MHKLDSIPSVLTLPSASHLGPESNRRLIVLIPDAELDYTAVMQRVWGLANTIGMNVQFLGLCWDESHEPGLRRQLITLSAMVQQGNVRAEARVGIGTNWLDVFKADLQGCDLIVCLAEQRVGLLQRPLSQILESTLSASIYVLSGVEAHIRPRPGWLSQILVWTGSVGILAGSGLLQIRIASLPGDWVQTTLLILSVVFEVWLIWMWSSLFG